MKSVKYLLDLQKKLDLNDTALGKTLNVTQAAISQYKAGKRIMDDETCLAVAMQLNIDPLQIVGAACIDRAQKSGQSSLWEIFMSRTAATAASALIFGGVTLFLTPNDANAATPPAGQHTPSADRLYIM
ncbi:MAG TPA: helix-turn-helix transcriptional regulator [Burkholderiaceae bacterium]|nr:helix-turn-helix transcriptional regulator [Burkholderiaceae bacterium]